MLDGASRVQEVVAAAADGQPALGITDHGVMYGVLDFYKACRAAGIKPVIGTELYQAAEDRSRHLPLTGAADGVRRSGLHESGRPASDHEERTASR